MSGKRIPDEVISRIKDEIRAGLPRGDIRARYGATLYTRAAKDLAPGKRGRPPGLARVGAAGVVAALARGESAAVLAKTHGISVTTVRSLAARQDMQAPFEYPPALAALDAIELDDEQTAEVERLKQAYKIIVGMLAKSRIADEKVRGPGSP